MILFKYCSGLHILATGSLKFAPPNTFNDPFEFAMNVDASGVTKEELKAYLKSSDDMFEGWWQKAERDMPRSTARTVYDDTLDHIVEDALVHFPENVIQEQENSCNRSSDWWAVTCFSERRDSCLMWSHYADRHRGIVIEFDSQHLPFNGMKAF